MDVHTWSGVLALMLAFCTTSASADFCSGRVDGYYADTSDCRYFIRCFAGNTIQRQICATGTVAQDGGACVWPYQSTCKEISPSSVIPRITTTQPTSNHPMTTSEPSARTPTTTIQTTSDHPLTTYNPTTRTPPTTTIQTTPDHPLTTYNPTTLTPPTTTIQTTSDHPTTTSEPTALTQSTTTTHATNSPPSTIAHHTTNSHTATTQHANSPAIFDAQPKRASSSVGQYGRLVMAEHVLQEGILERIMVVSLVNCCARCISTSCMAFNYNIRGTASKHECQLLSKTAMSHQALTLRVGFSYYELYTNDD